MLGIPADDILRISAKTGEGVPELLDAVIERIPAPTGDPDAPLQALIFDSYYDSYRGVVSSVRVMNGVLKTGSRIRFMQAGATHEADEIGVRRPDHTPVAIARPGRDRLPHRRHQGRRARPAPARPSPTPSTRPPSRCDGYRDPKPMVFCGLYPIDGDEFADLREALEKLRPQRRQLHLRARDVGRARASASAAASSACSTWRSSASDSSASSTST